MRYYTERPKPVKARKAWEYFYKRNPDKKIKKLWFNPNCWGRPMFIGNMWGWWVCEFEDGSVDYEVPGKIN